jgi:hypothetical protein
MDMPKLHASYRGRASGTVIIGEERAFTEQEALEIIRRVEAHDGLVEKMNQLRYAAGLLNSMILSGEKHSKVSRKVVKDAFTGNREQALSGEPKE